MVDIIDTTVDTVDMISHSIADYCIYRRVPQPVDYRRLLQTVADCHDLLQPAAFYCKLLNATEDCRRLPHSAITTSTTDNCRLPHTTETTVYYYYTPSYIIMHRLAKTAVNYHKLLQTTACYCTLTKATVHNRRLPHAIVYCRISHTTADYHSLSQTITDI